MSAQSGVQWPVPWRVLLLLAILGTLAVVWGDLLAEILFPLWRWEIGLLDSHWMATRLWIDHEGADRVIRASIGLHGCLRLPVGLICDPVEPLGNASTLLGNLTLPTALMSAIVLGWPAIHQPLVVRTVRLVGALLLLWALDVPFALGAAFALVWRDAVAPDSGALLLMAWGNFLQSGGRLGLALLLAGAVLVLPAAKAKAIVS